MLDPETWAAVERCVKHHEQLRTLNPHVLVNFRTASRNTAAAADFISRVLRPAAVTMRGLRSTRLSCFVAIHDPMLVAAAFGLTAKAATYYLGDSLDHEHAGSLSDRLG